MYRKILVPVDGSDTGERGLAEALRLAGALQAQVVLLHVVDTHPLYIGMAPGAVIEQSFAALAANGEQLLAQAAQRAQEAGVGAETKLRDLQLGRVADIIVEEAHTSGADLIVMGTHGRRGFNRLRLGSDAEQVVRESPVPVLLVRHV